MSKNILVSVIQSSLVWENKEKNMLLFSGKIEKLKGKTNLVVLPEMFNTGFSLNPEQNFETMEGETILWLKSEAKKNNLAIAGSLIIKEDEKFYNRLVFAYPSGEIKHYDKRHLFRMANEHKHYKQGEKQVVVEYLGWKINLLVCYDLRFPVWSRNNNNRYDLSIYVANWPSSRIAQWQTLLAARAIENQAYVVGVNRIGYDGNGFEYSGSSIIFSPLGKEMIENSENTELIETVELSYEKLSTYRKNFPVSADADSFEIIK